jgi:hypothetical protein
MKRHPSEHLQTERGLIRPDPRSFFFYTLSNQVIAL